MAQLYLINDHGLGWEVDSSGNLVPNSLNTTGTLGTVGNPVATVYATDVSAADDQTVTGDLDLTGGLTIDGTINVSGHVPAGTQTNGTILSSGGVWTSYTTAGAAGIKLLLENACDTGEFATARLRARANNTTAAGNGAASVGTTTCVDASASAQDHEYGNLRAGNFVAQPNAKNQTTDSTNIVNALYARVDRTGTSVGRTWVLWVDTHQETKSDGSDFLMRLSHNGTVANAGAITVYNGGRMPVLFNFEDAAGFLDDTDQSLSTQAGALTVTTPAGTRYIPLYSS